MTPGKRKLVWRLAPDVALRLRAFEDAVVAYETRSGDTLCFPAMGGQLIEALQKSGPGGLATVELADRLQVVPEQLDELLAELRRRGIARAQCQ